MDLSARTTTVERPVREHRFGKAKLIHADCLEWLDQQPERSIHGVVTDPPYGLKEYQPDEQKRLRAGNGQPGHGGIWRIPPTLDGSPRSPLPRFTVLSETDKQDLNSFFCVWGESLLRVLTPGAHVMVASNPLLVHRVAAALEDSGFEPRGMIIRTTQTLRGGDRPKGAHDRYENVTVMPKSLWEPWVLVRRPISEGTVALNLDRWGTGGLRRSAEGPFRDLVVSSPTRGAERDIAPHPSLKPQKLLRHLVKAILPLGAGIVLDPFAGSGSTLAAAEAVGCESIGVELDSHYFELARQAIPLLADLSTESAGQDQPGRATPMSIDQGLLPGVE